MLAAIIIAFDSVLIVQNSLSDLSTKEVRKTRLTSIKLAFVREGRLSHHVRVADVAVMHYKL